MVFSKSTIVNMVAEDFVISEAFSIAALLTFCTNSGRSVINKFYGPKNMESSLASHHSDIFTIILREIYCVKKITLPQICLSNI